jgi:glycosyltransferase involved in cell wall biosynthesis
VSQRIDVIIPTWNEEAWLPRLLNCLAESGSVQTVIVADNDSDDGTRAIAQAHGCRLVAGGRPARGRNAGAMVATGDILLFVDADTILPVGYLEGVEELFRDEATIAVYFRNLPLTTRPFINVLYTIMDGYIAVLGWLGIAQGVGTSIAVRASAFRRAGGFPEDVDVAIAARWNFPLHRQASGLARLAAPAHQGQLLQVSLGALSAGVCAVGG